MVSRDALGQAGDRDAGVGREAARAGTQRAGRLVGAVAGVPEPAPLALVGGPVEAEAAVVLGDLADRLGLGRRVLRRAVELEQQRRADGQLHRRSGG